MAVVWTTPWESYLIRYSIWTYTPESVLGPTLFRIPIEEIFFFVIQTYTTSLIYILLNKPILFPIYLAAKGKSEQQNELSQRVGQFLIIGLMLSQIYLPDQRGTYLRLIILWAAPVALLLWYVRCHSCTDPRLQ